MISGKDARLEMNKAKKVLNDDSANVSIKFKAVYKLLDIIIRLVLDNRLNLVRTMEFLKVPKIKPTKKEGKDENKDK